MECSYTSKYEEVINMSTENNIDWLNEVEKATSVRTYGMEIANGFRYLIKVNITQQPQPIVETYENRDTEKYQFNVILNKVTEKEELDIALLKRENEKKYVRISTMKVPSDQMLKLSKRQTNSFIKFIKSNIDKIKDKSAVNVVMWRSGQSFKTEYHFLLM